MGKSTKMVSQNQEDNEINSIIKLDLISPQHSENQSEERQHSQDEIFDKIIESITIVNFRELAGKKFIEDTEKKLEQKHYIVLVTENVLEKAKSLGYQLAMNNGLVYVFNGRYWVSIAEAKLY